FLIAILAFWTTVIGQELSTVAPTKAEIPEPPGFFQAAFSYLETGLKRLFGFKEEEARDNSTSVTGQSELLRVLSKNSDRTQQLLGGGSAPVGNSSTVTLPAAVIVVKEDATTQKEP
ncbi:hypothetical protein PMAYCL1PPCAC_24465, partial [Pristionchus mayeri]